MCRCAERRTAIVGAIAAIARGDVATAKADADFVIRSAAQDASTAMRKSALAASHARLKRR